eukprot:3523067-Rhodomonas_salina.3
MAHSGVKLCACYGMPVTGLAYAATRCPAPTCRARICLRACYAISGTDLAHTGLFESVPDLRFHYLSMPEIVAAQVPHPVLLRACYAVLGTELPYGVIRLRARMRCPILASCVQKCCVYQPTRVQCNGLY